MNRIISIVVATIFGLALIVMAFAAGLVSLPGPRFPDFNEVTVDVTLPAEARIVDVRPINLDCRARIHAEIPVTGVRDHTSLGVVYRTDQVSMLAIGDVDTCVDGAATKVIHNRDGTTEVVIPGPSIRFVRPRVDTVKTAESFRVDKGALGKLSDSFPWVDDNTGLAPVAYAYAQTVIGSSECMRAAYNVTQDVLVDAYRAQVIDQGVDGDKLTVRIAGEPDFDVADDVDLGAVRMDVGPEDEIVCETTDQLQTPRR